MKRMVAKIMLVGRAMVFIVGLTVVLAVVLGVATTGLAATGDRFILGKANSAGTVSKLTSAAASPTLQLINKGTTVAATALNLDVPSGHAPLTVNADAGTATNLSADELDGRDSTDFLGAHAKAAGADTLDGLDSTDFVQGHGSVYQAAADLPQGSDWSSNFLQIQNPDLSLNYWCPNDLLGTNGSVSFGNSSGETVNVFSDNGSANPTYEALGPGQYHTEDAASDGEHLTLQIQATGPRVVTIEVFSVQRPGRVGPGDCHVEAQALVTR